MTEAKKSANHSRTEGHTAAPASHFRGETTSNSSGTSVAAKQEVESSTSLDRVQKQSNAKTRAKQYGLNNRSRPKRSVAPLPFINGIRISTIRRYIIKVPEIPQRGTYTRGFPQKFTLDIHPSDWYKWMDAKHYRALYLVGSLPLS